MTEVNDLLSINDLDPSDLAGLVAEASALRASPDSGAGALTGRQVALVFEKPSTRTRVSFQVAVQAMGGSVVALRNDELQLGRGETIEDTGRVLSRYVDCIVVRTSAHDRLERLAAAASVPVVNALSEEEHPCQTLADLQTIAEHFGDLEGRVIAYVGDFNNVARSLTFGAMACGMSVRIGCPPAYGPRSDDVARAEEVARGGATFGVSDDPNTAVRDADVIYTDVWVSMGQEAEGDERDAVFVPYQVNEELLGAASQDAIVMHCLPAHRGQEISAGVMDGPRSVVWDQAENRLHAQKALLARLLG